MIDPSSPEFQGPQGISLDELTQAYAQAMGKAPSHTANEERSSTPGQPDAHGDPEQAFPQEIFSLDEGDEADGEISDDGVPVSPLSVVETLLFVGSIDNRPLTATQASQLMRGVTPGDVGQLVEELNTRYRSNGCPYKIESDGDGYRLTLRKAFYPVRNKFYGKIREARLSQAAVDTLAIVAYRQPLTSEQVSQLRGTPSGHLLTQLVRRQLLEADREAGTRQVFYRTSDRFLELFGLESLEDLPDSE